MDQLNILRKSSLCGYITHPLVIQTHTDQPSICRCVLCQATCKIFWIHGLWRLSRTAILRFVLVVGSVFVFAGCGPKTQEAMQCEDVLHPALWSVPFDQLDASNAEEWIAAHFPGATIIHDGVGAFAWGSNEKDFNAYFNSTYRYFAQYPGGRLYINPKSTDPEPTVADVLRCFGRPELYAVRDIPAESMQIKFSMWYLSRGLIFETVESKGFIPKKFNLTSMLHGPLLAVPSGSAEQMASSWWTTDPEYIASLMADLKPWPKDFHTVE